MTGFATSRLMTMAVVLYGLVAVHAEPPEIAFADTSSASGDGPVVNDGGRGPIGWIISDPSAAGSNRAHMPDRPRCPSMVRDCPELVTDPLSTLFNDGSRFLLF